MNRHCEGAFATEAIYEILKDCFAIACLSAGKLVMTTFETRLYLGLVKMM